MNLGPMEIIVILAVALLIFGPKNLPKLGSAVGKTVKNVREGMEGDDKDDKPADKPAADVIAEATADADAMAATTDVEASLDDVVFCSKCGTKNAVDAAFCSKCGTKLATE